MSRTQEERRQIWRRLIAEQEQSGLSVRAFSKQRRISEHSFYQWRKRLGEQLTMKFALVETSRSAPAGVAAVLFRHVPRIHLRKESRKGDVLLRLFP